MLPAGRGLEGRLPTACSDSAMDVEAGMPPVEDLVYEITINQLSVEEKGKDLPGKEFTDGVKLKTS